MTIYKIETGQYVECAEPLLLTDIEDNALEFEDEELDEVLALLNGESGEGEAEFAKGRPKDRQV